MMYMPGPEFRIGSPFGPRKLPCPTCSALHKGQDYPAPKGTPVPAAASGEVIYAGEMRGYGNVVIIRHTTNDGEYFLTLYAHLDKINVKEGQYINIGDIIGNVGNTGASTGPHLHFEVRIGKDFETSKPVNPSTFNAWPDGKVYDYRNFNQEHQKSNEVVIPNNQYYIVQPGDTLSKIAKRYGVDLNDLINENRRRGLIKDPNLIYPGQRIYIPGYQDKTRHNVQEGSRRIDPLVIDLDGDGIKLVNINKSNAMFDLTGSGFANKTGWISSGDAFLVWDKNNNGRIDDISEMFGSANQSGFKALALYDTNRDGKIDAFDDVFKNLKLWQDRNGDGRTDEGELLSLRDVGIKSINLNTTKTNINQEGNTITEVGSVEFEDGRKTQAGNVNFELDRLYSYYNREVELNPEIVGLPWVRGYGFMPDLPIAMNN